MSAVLVSVLEILAVGFTVWALFHEERLADFERRMLLSLRRRRLKVVKGNRSVDQSCA